MAKINASSKRVSDACEDIECASSILKLQQTSLDEIIQYIDNGWNSNDAAELESCVRQVKKKVARVNGFIKTSANGLKAGKLMIEAAEKIMLDSK